MTTSSVVSRTRLRAHRSRLVRAAGWIVTAAGAGHTIGSLIESIPGNLSAWFDGHLWSQTDFVAWAMAAWVAFTFVTSGPSPLPVLLIAAALLLVAARRAIHPPS